MSSVLFDPHRRALHRDRAMPGFAAHDFLHRVMVDELFERLAVVQRPLTEVLLIGCMDDDARSRLEAMGKTVTSCDPGFHAARAGRGAQVDEDALPFADNSFDLVIACGTLDSVNDLPGALVLIKRILRPDGLFLGAMTGAGSLARLRGALIAGEGDRASPHIHPQVELRAAGDLLQRAGFAMPVVDSESITARYGSLFGLMADLRGMGVSNALSSSSQPLRRDVLGRAAQHFADQADPDGKTREDFALLYLSAWKPDPSQPAPARRGSATVSLAAALKPKDGPA